MKRQITVAVEMEVLSQARSVAIRRQISLDTLVEQSLRSTIDRDAASEAFMSLPATSTPAAQRVGVRRWSREELSRRGLEVPPGR